MKTPIIYRSIPLVAALWIATSSGKVLATDYPSKWVDEYVFFGLSHDGLQDFCQSLSKQKNAPTVQIQEGGTMLIISTGIADQESFEFRYLSGVIAAVRKTGYTQHHQYVEPWLNSREQARFRALAAYSQWIESLNASLVYDKSQKMVKPRKSDYLVNTALDLWCLQALLSKRAELLEAESTKDLADLDRLKAKEFIHEFDSVKSKLAPGELDFIQ